MDVIDIQFAFVGAVKKPATLQFLRIVHDLIRFG
jgi:hypothetical protein